MKRRLFIGPLVHSISSKKLEILPQAVLGVGLDGNIEFLYKTKQQFDQASVNVTDFETVELKKSQFLIPGFVDIHTHAPQYINSGLGLDEELLKWLNKYTFPAESKFSDLSFAEKVYTASVHRHLRNGSTTCVYFATIHEEASTLLAKICNEAGQRAFVGKVNMDMMAPDFYMETTQNSLRDTESFIQRVLELSEKSGQPGLVQPIITPRFAVTCSTELMKGLSALAQKYNLAIQSHISENKGEIQLIKRIHDEKTYTHTYDQMGLLTDKTIMAHGIFLTENELNLLKERGTTICHCPLSNFSLMSGVADVRRLLDKGVKVGLGTDVSGGYSPSMLNAIRNAIIASSAQHSHHHHDYRNMDDMVNQFLADANKEEEAPVAQQQYKALTMDELFYLATIGGAASVGLQDKVGNFEPSKSFDALLIDVNAQNGPIDSFLAEYEVIYDMQPEFATEEARNYKKVVDMFERFMHCGDDRNIESIFVQGRRV